MMNSTATDVNITMLNNYFRLFDASRTDKRAMRDLLSLFTPDAEIVLNGTSHTGFEGFMKAFMNITKILNICGTPGCSSRMAVIKPLGPCAVKQQMDRCMRRRARTLHV